MPVSYDVARDQMFALFLEAWNANATDILAYIPEIRWQGKEVPSNPPSNKHWCRVSTQSVLEKQATLADGEGSIKYESSGLIFVQLFSPKMVATAYDEGQKLAIVARNAFRGKTTDGNVWFRNVRINNLPPEELFYRFNVVAEYEFLEVG